MAALHSALQSLGPAEFSSVPTEEPKTREYLQHLFAQAQVIIDSVPLPPEAPSTPARSRSSTATDVSCSTDLSASSARPDPIDLANTSLQKEWSKPYKLGAKENPLGMSVYKLGAKDGRGAWFARRSVHEGMGFRKWKLGLQREFPETLEVQGGPGEGNIRGIGGERRVEKLEVDGVGTIEVYHLSAQFPGPTAPRDFVTMLVTSSSALGDSTEARGSTSSKVPRHFMVISKPCIHPDCPPRDGFVRGYYESIEFIREIPSKITKSSSTTDLPRLSQDFERSPSSDQAALVRNAQRTLEGGGSSEEMLANMEADGQIPLAKAVLVREGRKRGKTISFAESRGSRAKGEAVDTRDDESHDPAEQNPVEWVMVTRSDPGGSVPRFLVERGTPASIVQDASKFLDWACKKEHPVKDDYGEKSLEVDHEIEGKGIHAEILDQYDTNGHLAGIQDGSQSLESSMTLTDENARKPNGTAPEPVPSGGVMSSLTNAAVAGIESYAPQAVIDRLPGHQAESTGSSWLSNNPQDPTLDDVDTAPKRPSIASTTDDASFYSVQEPSDDASSASPDSKKTTSEASPTVTRQDRELTKFLERKKTLDQKLTQTKVKESKDKEDLTSKEEDRIRRAEEKHAREVAKHEQRYQKEIAKIEAKRVKDEQKEAERKKKAEEKDEKVKLTRERDAARLELEKTKQEKEQLKEQVGALQRENTALVSKIGKLEMGKKVLGEVQAEIESGGRSRSSSLRRKKGGSNVSLGGIEATVLAGKAL
ncbi:MAG: hypothetical protein Q9207_006627 [Kuettlingeria erythrocarpa]